MLYFPNAKINLGLYIVGKRTDGFHNIETVFYPVGLSDVLEILPHPEIEFRLTGIEVDGDANDNLCMKAYNLLKTDYNLPPVYMQLHKIIPLGAGLGGGSSDAAFVLKALNCEFKLNLSPEQLINYAARLGSDCAFFIGNHPAIATGRGEILSTININLKNYYLVLIKPDVHISTAEAYAGAQPQMPEYGLAEIIAGPVDEWKYQLKNDFEKSVFVKYPELGEIKKQLYEMGAVYAAMSGSGSTIFGLFTHSIDLDSKFDNCFVYTELLP